MALRLLYGGHTKWSTGRGEWGRGRGKGSCLPALMCSSLSEILIVAPATSQKSEQKNNTHTHRAHTPVKYKLNYIFYANSADRERKTHVVQSLKYSFFTLLFPSPFFSYLPSLSWLAFPSSFASTPFSTCLFSPLFLYTIVSKKFSMCPSVSTQAERVYAMVSACDTLQIAGRFSRPKVQKSKGAKRFPRLTVATLCRAPCCALSRLSPFLYIY